MIDENVLYTATVNVATGSLNMRKEPGKGSAIVTKIPKDATVSVFDDTNPDWYEVGYAGYRGYVFTDYLVCNKPEDQSAADPQETTTLISDDGQAFTLVGRWRIAED